MENNNNNFEDDLFQPISGEEDNSDFESELFQPVSSDAYNGSFIGENVKHTEVSQSGIKIGKKGKIFIIMCVVAVLAVILNSALDFSLTSLFADKMELASFEGTKIVKNYKCEYEKNDLEYKEYIKIKSCEDGKVKGEYVYIVGANFDYSHYTYEIEGNISQHKKDQLTIDFTVTEKDSKDETLCPETFTVVITDDYSRLKWGDKILKQE